MSNPFSNAMLSSEAQTLLKAVQDRLEIYVEKMAPAKTLSQAEGNFQQTQLWRGVIQFLFNQDTETFVVGWGYFLSVVLQHRDACFSPAYINRFRESVQISIEDRRNLERLLHLAYVTADPSSRVLSMKQINMNQILARLPSETMRQKLLEFYRL
jgi:hypothetical protein